MKPQGRTTSLCHSQIKLSRGQQDTLIIASWMAFQGIFRFPLLQKIKKRQHSPIHTELLRIVRFPSDYATPQRYFRGTCLLFFRTQWKIQWRCSWMPFSYSATPLTFASEIQNRYLQDVKRLTLYLAGRNVISSFKKALFWGTKFQERVLKWIRPRLLLLRSYHLPRRSRQFEAFWDMQVFT